MLPYVYSAFFLCDVWWREFAFISSRRFFVEVVWRVGQFNVVHSSGAGKQLSAPGST